MVDRDIQKSQQLLKRLKEEMSFLSSLMAQAMIVSSNLNSTWSPLEKIHKKNTEIKRTAG